MNQNFVQPPGCAAWPPDEARPTENEASNPLFDLSDSKNARKLARAIAAQNTMDDAGWLVGELSYAFQNMTFDAAAIKECVRGTDELGPIINALTPLKGNAVVDLLVYALQDALREEDQECNDS